MLKRALRWRLATSLLRPAESANCEPDDDEVIQIHTTVSASTNPVENDYCVDDVATFDDIDDPDAREIDGGDINHCVTGNDSATDVSTSFSDTEDSVLRASAVTYLSGVVIHYVYKKYKCSTCLSSLSKENCFLERDDELFVHFKAYDTKTASDFGNLKVPCTEFRSIIDLCLTIFERQINIMIYQPRIKKTMLDMCISAINDVYPGWFTECTNHKQFCIERLIVIKLKYELKIRSINSLRNVTTTGRRDLKATETVQKTVRRKLFY